MSDVSLPTTIQVHLGSVMEICQRYRVARLDVFGSSVSGDDVTAGDFDFIVEFLPDTDLGPWLSRLQELQSELATLLGKPVDLVLPNGLRNPHFIESIDRSRVLVYAA